MAIADRDGSVYRLRGPNPIMKDQKDWSDGKFELINFENESITMADANNPVKKFETDYNVVDIGEKLNLKKEVFEPIEKDKSISTIAEFMPVEEKPEVIVEKTSNSLNIPESLKKYEISFYAVPAYEKLYKDEFYGDEHTRTVYGKKIIFIGYIIEQSDLVLKFWAKDKLNVKSIVYPQNKSNRWWRIEEVKEKSNGYLITSLISDITPDFSD